jgi:hypothetical protein
MSRREQATNQLGECGDDVQRHTAAFQHRAALAQRQRACRIEDHVEATLIRSDVEGTIINHLAHAQRGRFLASGRAATADDACAAHARNLHRRSSDPAQTPGHKDRLVSSQSCLRDQRVPGRHAHQGQGGRPLERNG